MIIQSSPSLIGKESQVIQELTYDSITECDVYVRSNLLSSGILSGGTRIPSVIDVRLTKEMTALTPASIQLKIVALLAKNIG